MSMEVKEVQSVSKARGPSPHLTTCDYCKSDRRHSNTQSEAEYCDKKRIQEEMKFFVHFFCLLIVPFAESCVSRDFGWFKSLLEDGHEGCPTSCLAICVICFMGPKSEHCLALSVDNLCRISSSLYLTTMGKSAKIRFGCNF